MLKNILPKTIIFFFFLAVFFGVSSDAQAASVYYSVGQNATDHKTGSPTVTISSGTATFSVAQTSIYMGVGDRVTYNTTSIAYISGKISTTQWTLVTATGGTPADVTAQTVNSIAHEYTSLSAAEAGASDANHLNTSDLVTGNYILNIPCYYDSAADTTAVTVNGWTTGASNYINIYTPNNTSTEVNSSQRHQGKWDTGKYNLSTGNSGGLYIRDEYVRIEGLQFEIAPSSDSIRCVSIDTITIGGSDIRVSESVMKKSGGAGLYSAGINVGDGDASVYLKNNVLQDFRYGLRADVATHVYLYNNTANGCGTSFYAVNTDIVTAKNNISQNSTYGFYGNFTAASDYNISDLAADAPGANSKNYTTVAFADAGNADYHLDPSDVSAKGAGTSLASDSYYAFSTDIDGQVRDNLWDIGADESLASTFRTKGFFKTTGNVKFGN